MAGISDLRVLIFGIPVHFSGISRPALENSLGLKIHSSKSQDPQLFVEFVRSVRGYRRKGYNETSSEFLLGHGFALDYRRRVLHYPMNAPRQVKLAPRQTRHSLLCRTIAFALALLHENSKRLRSKQRFLYLHASAVATSKGALIFCGESTFGKSTISGKLLKDFPKLDDDLVILSMNVNAKRKAPRFLKFSTKKSRRGFLCVAGIFWLRKSESFSIQPIERSVFASRIIMPMANWTLPHAIANRLAMIRQLTRSVPCADLSFAKKSAPLVRLLKQHDFI